MTVFVTSSVFDALLEPDLESGDFEDVEDDGLDLLSDDFESDGFDDPLLDDELLPSRSLDP